MGIFRINTEDIRGRDFGEREVNYPQHAVFLSCSVMQSDSIAATGDPADHAYRLGRVPPCARWSPERAQPQSWNSRLTLTCSATPPGTNWQTTVRIRGPSSTTSATRMSATPCATPSFGRSGSRTSGKTEARHPLLAGNPKKPSPIAPAVWELYTKPSRGLELTPWIWHPLPHGRSDASAFNDDTLNALMAQLHGGAEPKLEVVAEILRT